jgi:hypothetical protein
MMIGTLRRLSHAIHELHRCSEIRELVFAYKRLALAAPRRDARNGSANFTV